LTLTGGENYFDLDVTQKGFQFQREPLPLAAVYFLDAPCTDPTAPCVEGMSAQDGLIALVANTWPTRILDKPGRAREFLSLGRIATTVPVRRVRPHADAGFLTTLCDVILEDFQANGEWRI
jgi:hypothetical protein